MKKLLLTLGAVASVAAPVAAVVACSSDDNTNTKLVNGADIKDAFKDHLTYGEMFHRTTLDATIAGGDFNALLQAEQSFDDIFTATGSTDSTKETAIDAFVTAIETFNNTKSVLPTDLTNDPSYTTEKTLFENYAGKTIEAVLFYQDAEDKKDNAGAATVVTSGDKADWVNAPNQDWNEMVKKAAGFDDVNSAHKISGDHFGIRFDIVE